METTYYIIPNPYVTRRKIHAALKMAEKKKKAQKKMNQIAAVLLTTSLVTCICTGFTVISGIHGTKIESEQYTKPDTSTITERIEEARKEINVSVEPAMKILKDMVKEQAEIAEEKVNEFVIVEQAPLDNECKQALLETSEEKNIDPRLVLGLIEYESGFDPNIISVKGCYGYMQLNPKYFPANLSPADNIREGIKHFANQVEKYDGDIPAALRAYNLGSDDGDREYSNTVLTKAREHWEYPG